MLFANNCNTTLNGGITAVATSMVVTSATGFPSPTGSQYFYCTLADAATQTTIEIVKVTAVSGTTFTIVRGQDGTTGTIFASGAVVSLRLVAASLNDFPKLDETNTFTQAQTFSALTAGRIPFSGTGGLQSDSSLLFWDATNSRLGVGTSSPAVQGIDVWRDGIVRLSTAVNAIGQLQFFNTTGSTENARIQGNLEAAADGGNLTFYTKTTAAAINERMRIFASGGVSIGNTTDPGATNLSVTGSIASGSSISATGQVSGSSGAFSASTGSISLTNASYGNIVSTNTLYIDTSSGAINIRPAGSVTGSFSTTGLVVTGTVKTSGYTVATLPTGVTGAVAYVTNALAPTYGSTVVGGGSVTIPVFYNGTNWIVA